MRRGGDNKTCPTGAQGEDRAMARAWVRVPVSGWDWQGKRTRKAGLSTPACTCISVILPRKEHATPYHR